MWKIWKNTQYLTVLPRDFNLNYIGLHCNVSVLLPYWVTAAVSVVCQQMKVKPIAGCDSHLNHFEALTQFQHFIWTNFSPYQIFCELDWTHCHLILCYRLHAVQWALWPPSVPNIWLSPWQQIHVYFCLSLWLVFPLTVRLNTAEQQCNSLVLTNNLSLIIHASLRITITC